MNTITQQLLSKDPTLSLHDEGEWSNSKSEYSAFNNAGVECEVGEFLYGWLRVLKPTRVLETGTHQAIGAAYMGSALADNNKGHLDTIEFIPEIHARAKQRIETLGLSNWVTTHLGDVAKFEPKEPYQFMLLDTEPILRFNELIKFFPHLEQGGFLFIHDLHRHMQQVPIDGHEFAWPYGRIPEAMLNLVKTGKLRPFHFFTPRGLTGFYKVSDLDFKWE